MAADRYTDLIPDSARTPGGGFRRADSFISLRWKLAVPLFSILLAGAMVIAYLLTDTLVRGGQVAQTSQIQIAARGTQEGMQTVYSDLLNEARRIAYLQGLARAAGAGDTAALQALLEPELASSGLDSVSVLNTAGAELFGIRRSLPGSTSPYAVSTGTDMRIEPLVQAFLQEGRAGAAQLLRTPDGYRMAVAEPIMQDGVLVGQILASRDVSEVLGALRGSGLSQVALYDGDGDLLQTTFGGRSDLYSALTLSREQGQQILAAEGVLPVQTLTLAAYPYLAAYLPFVAGQDVLGVTGVYVPASLPYAVDLSRQLFSLLMASLAAALVVAAYVALGWMLGRLGRVTATAQALASGDIGARTAMKATDEIGELGRSLDVYADRVQQRQESLRTMLRRQRRENARLTAILESMSDGIIVQDLDGRVLLMNEHARNLLGSQREFRRTFSALTAVVTDVLGPALAPGLYALGEPQRVPLSEKVLSAQAAAIMTISSKRVGTVIVLRDITEQVQREQAREALLMELARDVQEPLMELAVMRSPADADLPLQRFAYEVMRNAVRLQRLIMQIRDLSDLSPDQLEVGQRPIAVDDLLDALVAEWSPVAQASGLSLQIMILDREMHVLGDDRRLRWALGNLIDNALKYTLDGGQVMLIARHPSESVAEIVVQDTGVGINAQELPHVLTRFYRGTPRTPGGSVLRVPGMGQGLFIAHRVIQAHGGTLSIRSKPQVGTQVVCVLPLTSPVAMALGTAPAGGRAVRTASLLREEVPLRRPGESRGGRTG